MKGARAQKCTIDGTTFDSIAEACFYCWCVEAKELGLLKGFRLQPGYHMTDTVKHQIVKKLKTKDKIVYRTLLQESNYTADFKISSTRPIHGLIQVGIHLYDPTLYIIDVKGAFNKAASEFSLTQKMLYALRGIYVNKVVVAYDSKYYKIATRSKGFFANNGVPQRLPRECYQQDGKTLYASWRRMFDGLPSIKEKLE